MHYYQNHIGDYRKDTWHLNYEEHGLYRALMDQYYLCEKPLTLDIRDLMRKMRLTSDQKEMLETILKEFFIETANGWKHTRIDEEIAIYRAKAAISRANGAKGGRPKQPNTNPEETQQEPSGLIPATQKEPTLVNHKPLTINHKPEETTTTSKPAVSTGNGQVPFEQIINKWNDFADKQHLPRVVKVTTTLKGQIRQRWKDMPKLENWDNFFQAIGQNDFLAGRAPPGIGRSKPFRSTLVWVTKEGNFAKIAAEEYE